MRKNYKFNVKIVVFMLFAAVLINCFKAGGRLKEAASPNRRAYIALIIDDFGGGGEGSEEFLNLPIKFTGAVMPFMEESKQDAALLKAKGNDVIIHLPMEAKKGKQSWLGEKAVLTNMTDEEISALLDEVFNLGYGVGVNNHMGSKATEDERVMSILFEGLSERDLLFVDSMTTPNSLSSAMAEKYGVRVLKRDVFLDSTNDKKKVIENLKKTKDIALKRGYAVCIGHVGAEGGLITAKAVSEVYKDFEAEGIEFLTVSELSRLLSE